MKKMIAGLASLLLGGALVTKAEAQTFIFHQFIYPKEQAHNAQVTLTHPNGIDTKTTTADTTGFPGGYWAITILPSWGLQYGDTVDIKVKTTQGDSLLTYRDVTDVTNMIWPFVFPGSPSISVRDISGNITDSVYVKCYKDGGLDTLCGWFDANSGSTIYDCYFNGAELGLNAGDMVHIEATQPGKEGRTSGIVQYRFIDADTFPSFTLEDVGLEEHEGAARQQFRVWPTITRGVISVTGASGFWLYNAVGRLIGEFDEASAYTITGPDGVYFVRSQDATLPAVKVIKKSE